MTGIILAGGQSKRLGFPKPFVKIGGKTLIEHTYQVLRPLVDHLFIVTDTPLEYLNWPVNIVTDIIPYQGPLGGIVTGMFYTTSFPVLVLACDLPFISQAFLKGLCNQWNDQLDALIPKTPDGHQPLCALYGPRSYDILVSQLKKGDLRLYQALKKLKKRYLSPEETAALDTSGLNFFNLNTPEDLKEAQRLWDKKHTQPDRCVENHSIISKQV